MRAPDTATVRLSGPTYSTMFTTCCGCAIQDRQKKCPSCLRDVEPWDENPHRCGMLRWRVAYGSSL